MHLADRQEGNRFLVRMKHCKLACMTAQDGATALESGGGSIESAAERLDQQDLVMTLLSLAMASKALVDGLVIERCKCEMSSPLECITPLDTREKISLASFSLASSLNKAAWSLTSIPSYLRSSLASSLIGRFAFSRHSLVHSFSLVTHWPALRKVTLTSDIFHDGDHRHRLETSLFFELEPLQATQKTGHPNEQMPTEGINMAVTHGGMRRAWHARSKRCIYM